MNSFDQSLATLKFGIGQSVPRSEDPVLLRGEGTYTADVAPEDVLHLAMLRSPYAHGVIRKIGTAAARAMPGVVAIYTGADLSAYRGQTSKLPLKSADGTPMLKPLRATLALDKVRYVGDPVACVVATTEAQARAAVEAIQLDVDALPCVTESRAALQAGAPLVYDDVPGNLILDYHFGDAQKVADAFAQAAHVTRLHLVNNRLVVAPMEPRACVASYEEGRFTLHLPVQSVMGMRAAASDVLDVPQGNIRIVARHVGGSFGMKTAFFPEYVCVAHAARALGHPVKWVDTRSESFVSDHQGRDHEFTCELALDAQGHFLALRVDGSANLGAYLTGFGPLIPALNVMKHIVGTYRTPLIEVRTKCVLTNTVPITAYRGAGRPEGNYYLERLVDTAAREMNIDPVELRRRNHIAPAQLPYTAPSGSVYDSGDFAALLDEALQKADYAGFAARERDSAALGKWRGIGIGQFLEVTAPGSNELGEIQFCEDGTVLLSTGTHDHGQGHGTTFAQVVADRLGIPNSKIRLMQTDSDALSSGSGTGGSKSIMAMSLDVSHVHQLSPSTYPNGVHIAEVEIDPETGEAQVVAYTSVNDFGTLVNPLIVAGQVQGGVVQGIGQCFLEQTLYTEDGQLATGSFMDYAMPRAQHAPHVHFASKPSPARTNALGVKGCGEAGCAGALTSVMNALTDALARHNVPPVDMPATPLRLFEAIRAASK